MDRLTLSFTFLLLLASNAIAQQIETIEVVDAYKDREPINISSFASSIEYVPLETSMKTLYSYPTVRGIQGDSIILVKSRNRTSLFDRNTGNFIRDVGHIGEDPNSYRSPGSLGYNNENGNVFVYGDYQEIKEYSLKENKIKSITKMPDLMEIGGVRTNFSTGGSINTQISKNYWSEQGFFVGLVSNLSGKNPFKLVLYNRQGEIIQYFKNQQTYEKKEVGNIRVPNNSYYEYAGMGHHKEWFSDTVFQFNKESIQPKYVFNTGKFSPPYKRQDFLSADERSRLMFNSLLHEDVRYVYFKLTHLNKVRVGLYDKETKVTSISEPEKDELIGYYNDLDGFLPFVPQFKTPEGKLVGTIRAQDVLKWFDENRRKARDLPENLKRLQNLEPEDNPIVMIVTPKYDQR